MQADGQRLGLVEDSEEDFAMFSRVFAPCADIQRWADGEAAVRCLAAGALADFSALVVDLDLPGIDGCEVIRLARAMEGGDAPTICMLSSSELPADARRARAAGADAYLVKPLDVAGLRALPGQIAAIAAAR